MSAQLPPGERPPPPPPDRMVVKPGCLACEFVYVLLLIFMASCLAAVLRSEGII